MGDVYKKAKHLFENELEKIVDKGDMSPTNLDFSYKLVDILKDISTICAMEESGYGYDEEYSGRPNYRNGYSRNYSYDGYAMPMRSNYSGNSMMAMKLRNLMNEATNDRERMMIQSWLNEVEN